MPPKNKAKQTKGSFLSRGRQKVQQKQQLKQDSSRKLPPGKRGGDLRNPGGAIVKRPNSQPQSTGGPVEQVRVRDLGSKQPAQLRGKQEALPPKDNSRRNAAEQKQRQAAQGTRGPNRVGQPAGSANRVYGANRVNDAVARAEQQAARSRALGRGTVAANIAGAVLNAPAEIDKAVRLARDPRNEVLKVANDMGITMLGKAKSEAKPAAKPERQGPTVPRRILAAGGGRPNPPKPEAPKTAPRPAETRYSGPPRTASQQPTMAVKAPTSPVKAPTAAKQPTAKQPDKPSMSGVGPVKDGELYADKLKISKQGDGPDMERRRAFLDAKDSMAGMKAVRDLLEKRKKRMAQG